MKVLIAYASSEGQTRKIARRVADHVADAHVEPLGHKPAGQIVELLPLGQADPIDLARYDRVILAASIHASHYQPELTQFAARHAAQLGQIPTLFLSVSLAAAGHDGDDWLGLERILRDFSQATGWTPGKVAQIAGAYRPSSYDLFRRFIMRRIIAAKDPTTDLDQDKEYTDWPALQALIEQWLAGGA